MRKHDSAMWLNPNPAAQQRERYKMEVGIRSVLTAEFS
ncbi:hypothetical protein MIDIC_110109 [Alphaproteobacteria bacterium]